jgi:hypothetical protein
VARAREQVQRPVEAPAVQERQQDRRDETLGDQPLLVAHARVFSQIRDRDGPAGQRHQPGEAVAREGLLRALALVEPPRLDEAAPARVGQHLPELTGAAGEEDLGHVQDDFPEVPPVDRAGDRAVDLVERGQRAGRGRDRASAGDAPPGLATLGRRAAWEAIRGAEPLELVGRHTEVAARSPRRVELALPDPLLHRAHRDVALRGDLARGEEPLLLGARSVGSHACAARATVVPARQVAEMSTLGAPADTGPGTRWHEVTVPLRRSYQ